MNTNPHEFEALKHAFSFASIRGPRRKLTVLNVAYPLAPVGPDAVGGAEQVLTQIDAALVQSDHHSIVIASEGSVTTGTLLATPRPQDLLTEGKRSEAWNAHRNAIATALRRWPVDLIHLHGVDFDHYLPPEGVPVLITLHLPPHWYSPAVFQLERPNTWLHCVSATQRKACPSCHNLLSEITNGTHHTNQRHAKRRFAIALGRICPEKGFHIALDAAAQAEMPLLLGGEVFSYPAHQKYFRVEIMPRLGGARRFIGALGLKRKRRFLSAARCLVAPSLVPETSSLVAMEALACGTPVVAFPAGALAEIVEHGNTGFLVNDADAMAEAMLKSDSLDPETCRRTARERFNVQQTTHRYLDYYHRLTERRRRGDFECNVGLVETLA